MTPWWKAHVLECGLWLERGRVFSEAAVRRNGKRTNIHRQLITGLVYILEMRKQVQSKTEWFSQNTNCTTKIQSVVCMTLKTRTFLYQIVSACPWPENGHLLTFVTSSLSEPSANLLLSKRYQRKLLPAFSSLLFCICQKREAGWEAGQEWCSPGLGSLQLGHSHCFSSHYNGYLWLQHLVSLTAQSVSSLPCFSQSPLFFAWLWNKHLAPLYWPKYVVSLPVSLKTVYSDQ